MGKFAHWLMTGSQLEISAVKLTLVVGSLHPSLGAQDAEEQSKFDGALAWSCTNQCIRASHECSQQ